MTNELPCNCFHNKEDHLPIPDNYISKSVYHRWCVYSEIGQCPCDYYTQMDNLEYLEWEDGQRNNVI